MTPVFIFDEANYMKSATLNDLKILFNFEMDSVNKAVIILAGLPQLNNTLRLASHEPLTQRIITNYEMEPLQLEEGKNIFWISSAEQARTWKCLKKCPGSYRECI